MRFEKMFAALCGAVLFTCAAQATEPAKKVEMRCGWFDNPTPGNATLTDRDGEWLIGEQGGHQADGDWPVFRDSQWVATNGNYGHGCACMHMTVDAKEHDVINIIDARARPLAACRQDHAIKEPE